MKRFTNILTIAVTACAIAVLTSACQGGDDTKTGSTSSQQAEKRVEVKELDAKTFDGTLKDAKTLVLVDYTASWCGPCQMLKPHVEDLAQEFKGKVQFVKVEQTNSPGLVRSNGVRAFPTLKIYAPGGNPLSTSVGYVSKAELRAWIQSQLDAYEKSVKAQNTSAGPSTGSEKK